MVRRRSSPIEQPKELKKKKLKKISDCIPLTIANLTRKEGENLTKVPKNTKEPFNPQEKFPSQPSSGFLEVASLQVVFPNTGKSKSSKHVDPSKLSIFANVYVPKTSYVAFNPSVKEKDVRGNDLGVNKTLETMNACDNPPSENNIDKILSEKFGQEKPIVEKLVDVPILYIDIKNIFNEDMYEYDESTEEDYAASQDDGNKDVTFNFDDNPQT